MGIGPDTIHHGKSNTAFFQGCDLWIHQTYSRERREGLHQSGKLVSEQDIFRVAEKLNTIFNYSC